MKLLTKLLAVFIPSTLLMMGAVMFLSKKMVHQVLARGVEDRGLVKARELADNLAGIIERGLESQILPQLQRGKEQIEASYAIALDREGKVLAHTNVGEKGKFYLDAITLNALRLNSPQTREIEVGNGPVLDVAVPVWKAPANGDFLFSAGGSKKTRVGTLRLGLPMEQTLQLQNKIFFRQAAMILLAMGGLALGLVLLMMRSVLRPVGHLARIAAKISEGEYGDQITVSSSDELGELTGSFNRMSKTLANTTVYRDAILSNMIDSVLVLSLQGTIESMNPAAIGLLGHSLDELLGKSLALLFAPGAGSFWDDLLSQCLKGITVRDLDVTLLTKTGQRIPALFSASMLRDKKETITGIICLFRDMTERKKLESMLMQSEKLSAVGQLAAGVAHEINNPLGIILGFVQSAIKRVKEQDPLTLPLKSIEREALRCRNLVRDLLAFSRQNKPKMEEFNLNEIVMATLSIVEAQARVKSVEMVKELEDLEPLLGDKNQLQQVIINLCNNAMDAMPNGGKIAIRTRKSAVNCRRKVILEVEDSGSGIPEEIRNKIFNPFFTTKEVGKGTGLGLSLVHEIVERHQGTIQLKSELGRGTVFTVLLPTKDSMSGETKLPEGI